MMKKTIALLMSVLFVMGCVFCVSAADAEEPQKTPSGYYVGQKLEIGSEIKSSFEDCGTLSVTYTVAAADAEFVTSALQKKFSDPSLPGVASFRDVADKSSEDFSGKLTVKGGGDKVDQLEIKLREFQSATAIYTSMSEDERKEKRIRKEFDLTIDYDYAHTTYNQYTSIAAWEIVSIRDDESALEIRVKAVFETREPNGFESFQEKMYDAWKAFLDKLGDALLKIVPKIIAFWARVLGKNR